MRTHVLRPLLRGIASSPQIHPTLNRIKWFGNDVLLRKDEEEEWRWSNDEVFERKLPSWAILEGEEENEGLLREVKEEETSDDDNSKMLGYDSDPFEGEEESHPVKKEEEDGEEAEDRPRKKQKRSLKAVSKVEKRKEKEKEDSESSVVEEEIKEGSKKKSGARKSLTSLFAQVAKVDKGKGKMKVRGDLEGEMGDTGDDSGFFDLGAKLV